MGGFLLTDRINSFNEYCVVVIEPNCKRINYFLHHLLMLRTALTRKIGYENATKVTKMAYRTDRSLKEIVIELSLLTTDELDEIVF